MKTIELPIKDYQVLTEADVLKLIPMSRSTLWVHRKSGHIKYKKNYSGRLRYMGKDVKSFYKEYC